MLKKIAIALSISGALLLAGCVTKQTYQAEVNQAQAYQALNNQLQTELKSDQVQIQQLEDRLKVTIVNELLFPEGGWQLNKQGEQILAKLAPTLASVNTIAQAGRARGNYQARFTEHAGKAVHTPTFRYAPDIFSPAELLLYACAARHSDQAVLPPRPALCVPLPVTREGLRYVPIHRLVEPARTGFQNWLRQYSEPPEPEADAPLGLAPEPLYAKFLHTAI